MLDIWPFNRRAKREEAAKRAARLARKIERNNKFFDALIGAIDNPPHRCHFVRWVSPALPGRCIYRCECGAKYGVGHDGWIHKPPFDPSKSKY